MTHTPPPPPRAIRLVGTLDTIAAARASVVLELDDGTQVPWQWEDHDLAQPLLETKVVVSGVAE